jgi:hypothetical protein
MQQLEAQAPELSLEMVKEFLSALVQAQAIQEREAAQLVAEFLAGSPERILALVQQYLKDQGAPVNPKMVSFAFWGGPIQVNFYLIDRLLTPLGYDGFIARLCAVTIAAVIGMFGLNAVFPPTSTPVAVSEVN